MLDSTLSDSQLREMLKQVVLTGDDDDKLTKTLLDMEQKFVFATTAAIAIPVAQEAALLGKLGGGAAYKTAAKFGLKWLFGGLGGVAVTATSILVYQQQKPQEPQQHKPVIALVQQHPDTSNFFVASKTDSVGSTPTISAPKEVTEQPYELLPLSPVSPIVSTPLERQEAVVVGNPVSMRVTPEILAPLEALADLGELAPLSQLEERFYSDDSLFALQSFDGVKILEINVESGNIIVTKANGNQVIVDQPEGVIATEQRQEKLSVFMKPMDKKQRKRHNDIPSFDLNIAVPTGTSLVIVTSSGTVDIEGLEGKSCEVTNNFGEIVITNCITDIKATASSGSIILTNITGKTDLHSYFGDVNLENTRGATSTHISSGNYMAHDVKGEMMIQSDFGDISIVNALGNTTINSSSGSITLDSLSGEKCTINSNFGDLYLHEITAESSIVLNSGSTSINKLNGNLSLNTQFGDVSIENLKGNLHLNGNSGDIHLKKLVGDLVVDSQFGNVTMKDTKGNVSVQANSGDINGNNVEVTDSLIVAVDFGNSDIELVNSAENLRFDVEASMGTASIHKGNLKLEEEDGHIITDKGSITIKGTAQSGNVSFD